MLVVTRGHVWDFVKADSMTRYRLLQLLSIKHPGARHMPSVRSGRWDGVIRYLVRNRYPSGLFEYITLDKTVVDKREKLVEISGVSQPLDKTLRDYQSNAVLKCLLRGNGLIHVATNGGKTLIMGAIIKTLLDHGYKKSMLILIHSIEIFNQLVRMFKEDYGIDVGVVQSGRTELKQVNVGMVKTVLNTVNSDAQMLDFVKNVGAIFVDECHHVVATTYQTLLKLCNARYRFGFSGTIPRKDSYKGMEVRKFLGPVLVRVTNEELIDRQISAKPIIYIHKLQHNVDDLKRVQQAAIVRLRKEISDEINRQLEQQHLNLSSDKINDMIDNTLQQRIGAALFNAIYTSAIVHNDMRNRWIKKIIFGYGEKNVLIIVDRIQHGILLKNLIPKSNFVSGQTDTALRSKLFDDFKTRKQKILIATNIVDEGLDIQAIDVLVLASSKKSYRQYLQRIGRALRKKVGENRVSIHDFYDVGHRILERHSKQRMDLYKKEGFDIEYV